MLKNLIFVGILFPFISSAQYQVNWGEVSGSFSRMFENERNNRELMKVHLDNMSRNAINLIQGNGIQSNNKVISYLYESFKASAMNEINDYNYKLKSGLLNPQDFNNINNTVVSQYNYAISLVRYLDNSFKNIENNAVKYSSIYNAIIGKYPGLTISFKTDFQTTNAYYIIKSQKFVIKSSNSESNIEEIDLNTFFSEVNHLF